MKNWQIIALILIVLFAGIATHPIAKNNKIIKEKTTIQEKEFQELNESLLKIQEKKSEIKYQGSLSKKIPFSIEQEKIIRDIEKIALLSGFTFSDINFTKGENGNVGLPELRINFSTEGSKEKLEKFLKLIEQNERFLGFENLSIHTGNEPQTIRFSVSLYSFYQNAQ